jgi:16S rRNA C1402 N4-methylase RsmH
MASKKPTFKIAIWKTSFQALKIIVQNEIGHLMIFVQNLLSNFVFVDI